MQNKTGVIYKLTFPNGKSYIGLTRNSLEKRFIGHCTKAKTGSIRPLYNAIRKYGRESVDVTVIASALVSDLAELEIQLIREHNTLFPNGYNLHSGGGQPPLDTNDNTRAKISAALKGRKRTAAQIEAIRERYAKMSPEEKQKISEIQRNKWTPETRAINAERTRIQMANQTIEMKIAAYEKRYGEGSYQVKLEKEAKKITNKALRNAKKVQPKIKLSREEINRRISEAQRIRNQSPELRARVSASMKGKPKSEEHRKNMVAGRKARHNSKNDGVTEI